MLLLHCICVVIPFAFFTINIPFYLLDMIPFYFTIECHFPPFFLTYLPPPLPPHFFYFYLLILLLYFLLLFFIHTVAHHWEWSRHMDLPVPSRCREFNETARGNIQERARRRQSGIRANSNVPFLIKITDLYLWFVFHELNCSGVHLINFSSLYFFILSTFHLIHQLL
jgi:hypothetical protein